MQAFDSKILLERLNELAEVFDKKPISEKGLTVWFGVLREFPTERVCGALIGWPKTHTKFPSPAEVWKTVNDISINDRERKAELENKQEFYPGVGGEQAEKFIAQMREVLKRPKWTPMQHWTRLLATAKPGSIGYEYATQVLKQKNALPVDREPGQDDEEKAVNF